MAVQHRNSGEAEPVSPKQDSSFVRQINLSPRDKMRGLGAIHLARLSGLLLYRSHSEPCWLEEWSATIVSTLLFLALYLSLFWLERTRPLWHIAGMVILGLAVAPINQGAATFFIFASAFIPFCVAN